MGWHQDMDEMSDEEIAKSGLTRERLKEILPDEPIPLTERELEWARKVAEGYVVSETTGNDEDRHCDSKQDQTKTPKPARPGVLSWNDIKPDPPELPEGFYEPHFKRDPEKGKQ